MGLMKHYVGEQTMNEEDKKTRDMFAAAALNGYLANGAFRSGYYSCDNLASMVFNIADAMMAERKKRDE